MSKNQSEAKKTILVVDDEAGIRALLRAVLSSRGYNIIEAANGAEAIESFKASTPDMVILDVMMPFMDGFACCRKIRELSTCPILMLTAKGEDYDQVMGLESGADDYVVKPFTPMVLAARVEALFRRTNNLKEPKNVFGELTIDSKARVAYINEQMITLNRKEFNLLQYLVDNYNISLSRSQILEGVWGYDYLGSDSTVDTHINRLRNKLGKCSNYIKTMRGYGYKFRCDDEE